ncbi:MAG: DUF4492 domain-containing protein [Candidatus Limimorpha sp.]
MDRLVGCMKSIARFYVEGFKNMTWGRTLWLLIILKLIILFAILRVFFFKPVLAGKSDEERSEFVGDMLIQKNINDTITVNH